MQVSPEVDMVVWCSLLLKNLPQFAEIYTVLRVYLVSEAEIYFFFWNYLPFFYDPVDVDNLISDSSAISKSSLYICKFSVHVLLKPTLKYCGPVCGQSWRIVYIHLRRMCSLLLLKGMLCKYQLILPGLMFHLNPEFLYWYFVRSICPLIEMEVKLPHYYCAAVNFSSFDC